MRVFAAFDLVACTWAALSINVESTSREAQVEEVVVNKCADEGSLL